MLLRVRQLYRHWIRVVALGALLVVLAFAVAGPTFSPSPRANSSLLEAASRDPQTTLSVIIQKTGSDGMVENLVAALGGRVTLDLWIINAIAAEVPARTVPQLATAAGVRWVSLDAPIAQSAAPCTACINTIALKNAYNFAIGATRVWNEYPYLQGQGVTVAVVDSGIDAHSADFHSTGNNSRVSYSINFSTTELDPSNGNVQDHYGHGTHVAGLIGGNGAASGGGYIGIAPKVNLLNVKVSDSKGMGSTKDVVAGLQWVYEHKTQYNIRVVNISLNSSVAESYHTSPLDAALEILWFNRIVVVVSAGNSGNRGILYPPANDPFVITVGAMDDKGTADTKDDVLASFSPAGKTQDKISKPDIVAPGANLISVLASNGTNLAQSHSDHIVTLGNGTRYFRMTGTSMSSAVTAGAVALLLQSNSDLNPDQVKYRLMNSARPLKYKGVNFGYLDIYAAVHSSTTKPANLGLLPCRLLQTGSDPATWTSVNWDSVNWDSVSWDSVNWDSVNWDSVNWDSVNWDSAYWGD